MRMLGILLLVVVLGAWFAGVVCCQDGEDMDNPEGLKAAEGKIAQVDFANASIVVEGLTFHAGSGTSVMKRTDQVADPVVMAFTDLKKGDYVRIAHYGSSDDPNEPFECKSITVER